MLLSEEHEAECRGNFGEKATSRLLIVLANRLNSRSFATAIGAVLIAAGFYLVVKQVSAEGSLDLKAACLQGKLESGSVGLFFMFCGVIVVIAALMLRRSSKLSFDIRSGRFEYEGYISIERFDRLGRFLRQMVLEDPGGTDVRCSRNVGENTANQNSPNKGADHTGDPQRDTPPGQP